MARGRQKGDGRGRLGGRAPGTPNKTSGAVKAAITQLVEGYLNPAPKTKRSANAYTLEDDLAQMQPQERAKLITGLAGYIIPKQQALSIEDQTRVEAEALTTWLETAPDEAIDAIAAKVLEMQARNAAARQAATGGTSTTRS